MTREKYLLLSKVFENKTDRAGKPYIEHLERVAQFFIDPDLKEIALLHDLIEDSPIELKDIDASPRVREALALLTKGDSPYEDYITQISKNKDAAKVKISDLLDNMNTNRLNGPLSEIDKERCIKYAMAYIYLIKNL